MMKKWIKRSLIVIFWIILIGITVYAPRTKIHHDENTINIFAWGDILDADVIAAFEKETGIRVHLSYYATNEELIVKLLATEGIGYDLIIPSDYAVPMLVKQKLLQPLDPSKIHFWKDINPLLLNLSFDPKNHYSIPFSWEVFGLGIDENFFQDRPIEKSWSLIFDQNQIDYKIAMVNEAVEGYLMAGLYLYGNIDTINTDEAFNKIKALLMKQKKWVEAYADFRGDYFLATKNCPVAVASSSYIWRTKRMFPFVRFIIPEEGSFISIENMCIPKKSEKQDNVYRFLNYLYRAESIAKHYETYGYFPAAINALDRMDLDPEARALILQTREDFNKLHYFKNVIPQDKVRDLWIEVRSF